MDLTERAVYPTTSARQARGRRTYLRNLVRFPVAARSPDRCATPTVVIKDGLWLLGVAILSIPSLVFGLLFIFYVPGDLAKFLDLELTEALAVSGLFGALTAFAAFVVTMTATLRGGVARMTRIALWTLVVLSLASWLYVWFSFLALAQMPPLIPLKM